MSTPGPQRFVGKVALVTGAASGIGNAAALRLAEEGARVALADLDQPEAARVAESIRADGGQALALRLDVRSEPDWQAAMDRILAECGRLDISVHSAGVAFAKPIMELDLAGSSPVSRRSKARPTASASTQSPPVRSRRRCGNPRICGPGRSPQRAVGPRR